LHFARSWASSGRAIHPSFWLGIAILSAVVSAATGWLVLGLRRPERTGFMVVVLGAVAAAPLWVPGSEPVYRLAATLVTVGMLVKLYDLLVGGTRPPFREFLPYLFNVFLLVYRRRHAVTPRSREENLRALGWAIVKTAVTLPFCVWAFRARWDGIPFLVEHIAKAGTIALTIEPGCAACAALWRLSGHAARDFMIAPMLASTPAEFWRRYNRPVQQFFHEDLFLPLGGRRAPARATFRAFVVSALIHEYVFGIIIGRVQGYQALFFLIQGLAVIATLRARPRGAMKWIARAGTLTFNLVTSVLFFASWDQFLPFYSRPLPWPLAAGAEACWQGLTLLR
jgi:hypothetical protein